MYPSINEIKFICTEFSWLKGIDLTLIVLLLLSWSVNSIILYFFVAIYKKTKSIRE